MTDQTNNEMIMELRRLIAEYQTIFENMPIMVWYKDDKNRMLRINRAAAEFEGVDPAKIEGKRSEEVYPKEQAEAFYQDDLEVLRSRKPKLHIIEQHSNPATGELMWVQTGKVPYFNAAGEAIGVIAFAVDITEQKKAEDALREKNEALEAANQVLRRLETIISSTLDHIEGAVQRDADKQELLGYLAEARREFDRFDWSAR